jgi:hypothetical protein
MRKSKAFRPTLPDALELRLVLSGVSALSLYRAGLVRKVDNVLGNMVDTVNRAFYNGNLNLSSATTAGQFSELIGSVQAEISDASTQIGNLVSSLRKSKNLMTMVQNELGDQPAGLSAAATDLLTRVEATLETATSTRPGANSSALSLAFSAITHMEDSVRFAIENQVKLFLYARVQSRRCHRSCDASMSLQEAPRAIAIPAEGAGVKEEGLCIVRSRGMT